jgi:hypothetical protein
MGAVRENILKILSEIPKHVIVVAAAKSKTIQDVEEAIAAGITIIGENYLQESRTLIEAVGNRVTWHFIGHIQKNKVKYIVPIFDMIETVDTFDLAVLIDQLARKSDKVMPVLIEVNIAHEEQKHGAMPEEVPELIKKIGKLPNIRVKGLMTMGPFLDDPSGLRPYFRQTRQLFEEIKSLHLPEVDMEHLSMGMSDSYLIAIEEGATMVRIGTKIFGPRSYA